MAKYHHMHIRTRICDEVRWGEINSSRPYGRVTFWNRFCLSQTDTRSSSIPQPREILLRFSFPQPAFSLVISFFKKQNKKQYKYYKWFQKENKFRDIEANTKYICGYFHAPWGEMLKAYGNPLGTKMCSRIHRLCYAQNAIWLVPVRYPYFKCRSSFPTSLKMAATRYRRFLKLCEEWPRDESKKGRDLGTFLRQKVASAFREGENTQVILYIRHFCIEGH